LWAEKPVEAKAEATKPEPAKSEKTASSPPREDGEAEEARPEDGAQEEGDSQQGREEDHARDEEARDLGQDRHLRCESQETDLMPDATPAVDRDDSIAFRPVSGRATRGGTA